MCATLKDNEQLTAEIKVKETDLKKLSIAAKVTCI